MECKAHCEAHLSFRHMVSGAVAKLDGFRVNADVPEPRLNVRAHMSA